MTAKQPHFLSLARTKNHNACMEVLECILDIFHYLQGCLLSLQLFILFLLFFAVIPVHFINIDLNVLKFDHDCFKLLFYCSIQTYLTDFFDFLIINIPLNNFFEPKGFINYFHIANSTNLINLHFH
jgi:hypothetical protein